MPKISLGSRSTSTNSCSLQDGIGEHGGDERFRLSASVVSGKAIINVTPDG